MRAVPCWSVTTKPADRSKRRCFEIAGRLIGKFPVQPQSRTGFEANTKLLVSRLSLAAFQPGAKIQVDPNDLQRVALIRPKYPWNYLPSDDSAGEDTGDQALKKT
jgi:hypothetical protein